MCNTFGCSGCNGRPTLRPLYYDGGVVWRVTVAGHTADFDTEHAARRFEANARRECDLAHSMR